MERSRPRLRGTLSNRASFSLPEKQNEDGLVTPVDTRTAEELPIGLERERLQLADAWREPPGFWGWFRAVHHTTIGKRYIITAFIFFLLGGILAALMRAQLARPEN